VNHQPHGFCQGSWDCNDVLEGRIPETRVAQHIGISSWQSCSFVPGVFGQAAIWPRLDRDLSCVRLNPCAVLCTVVALEYAFDQQRRHFRRFVLRRYTSSREDHLGIYDDLDVK